MTLVPYAGKERAERGNNARPHNTAVYYVVAAVDGSAQPWVNVLSTRSWKYACEMLASLRAAGTPARIDASMVKRRTCR